MPLPPATSTNQTFDDLQSLVTGTLLAIGRTSATGHSSRFRDVRIMSGLLPTPDIRLIVRHGGEWPIAPEMRIRDWVRLCWQSPDCSSGRQRV
jgi:hypothetical protein